MPNICIHGHFYQPPREDPWTGVIHPQPSALPFSDWNQRASQPNATEPMVGPPFYDGNANVTARINTYKYISFNSGPPCSVG